MTSPLEQKKIKITGPSVVTANRTRDGVVIYRTGLSDEAAMQSVYGSENQAMVSSRPRRKPYRRSAQRVDSEH